MTETIAPASRPIRASLQVPGDKSISHRAVMFGSLALGRTEVVGILESEDVRATRRCFAQLGVRSEERDGRLVIEGLGTHGLVASTQDLDCGNSGTTMRLLMGILAGQKFQSRLIGDASLSGRPMRRVATPLERMGARFSLTRENYAPLTVIGGALRGIDYALPVASAQIKTAILLAGVLAQGRTRVTGETESRDHTERLLPHFGVSLRSAPGAVEIDGPQALTAALVQVPGDPSSAAFWAAAAALVPGSEIEIRGVSLNPTRTGFLAVLKRMGISIDEEVTQSTPEPIGNLRVRAGELRATEITPAEVPRLIDELPLFAVLGAYARGISKVTGAEELRVKESDRIDAIVGNLRSVGARIDGLPDGFTVEGAESLAGGQSVPTFHDHRIAMAMGVAALRARAPIQIQDAECAAVSYPTFFHELRRQGASP